MSQFSISKANKKEVFRLLNDPDTQGLVVLAICLAKYEDYFDVDALEIYARLNDDFGVVLPQALENRLQALTTAMTTDHFETDPSVYDSIVKALTDGDPDLEHGDPDTTLDEMMWAEYEVQTAKAEPLVFSPAVEAVRAVLADAPTSEAELIDITETLEAQRDKLLNDLQSVGFEVNKVPEI